MISTISEVFRISEIFSSGIYILGSGDSKNSTGYTRTIR
jgi:hypothetical protein